MNSLTVGLETAADKVLTFIQATQRLTSSIIKGDCKDLKNFFQCDLEVKRTTRSSDKGNLQPPTINKSVPRHCLRRPRLNLAVQ
jgi:hypothetical protein